MLDQAKPILLFELGNLQVFCYQTMAEWSAGHYPKEIWWNRRGMIGTRGPFQNIYYAVKDYSEYIAAEKEGKTDIPDNVVFMDFKNKKRLK